MNLCDETELKALLHRHQFHFSKSMGQNFLIDPAVPRRIAEECGAGKDWGVLEVGPGVGTLTRELAAVAGKVVSVELDRALLPILDETLADCPNASVVPGDVMKLDLDRFLPEQFGSLPVMVCANLPYQITTPILTKFLETKAIDRITVMVQREVAKRICAPPGDREGSSFSLFFQYAFATEYLFSVERGQFLPPPKVSSAVIRCLRREKPPVCVADEDLLFRVIRGAFALRRKTLCNSLASSLQRPKGEIAAAIQAAGLPETVRGEELDFGDLGRLCGELGKPR